MSEIILAINIGNTHTRLGFFFLPKRGSKSLRIVASETILNERISEFLKDDKNLSSSILKLVSSVKIILLASTRPEINQHLENWSLKVFGLKPLKFQEDFKIPMRVLVKEPEKVGQDRLLNTFAVYQRFQKLAMVIDFGTAITLDIVSSQGEFLGGVIMPGITTMAKSLQENCALLPFIEPKPISRALGKNTQEAIRAGIYLGIIGSINYLIQQITAELNQKPWIVATGGDAALFKRKLPLVKQVIPNLTLEGLVLAYQAYKKNRDNL